MNKKEQLKMGKRSEVIIANPEKLAQLKKIFIEDGKDKIHVLADFDRTLTKAIIKGKKMPSIISILRDNNYLTAEYAREARKLFAKYHPIEIDPADPIG